MSGGWIFDPASLYNREAILKPDTMNVSNIMTALAVSAAIVFSLGFAVFTSGYYAFAQPDQAAEQAQGNQTGGGKSEEAKTNYKPTYPMVMADSRSSLTIQSDRHLYKPGEDVTVSGSVLTSLLADLGGDISVISIEVTDNKGTVVADEDADLDSDGVYSMTFTLPDDAELGAYSMNATIQADADLLGTLDASVSAKLKSTAKFVVVSPMAFAVNAEGKNFEVTVASNSSSVTDFAFEQAEKKVSFKVEGETGTKGVAQVTLPKELLAGQLMVSIDGRVVAEDSNDVIVTSDTASEMTLEINYPHSEHTIEITGTSVVPEFPVTFAVMAAAVASVVGLVALTRGRTFTYRT